MGDGNDVTEMVLPELDEGVTEAFIVAWYKAVGDRVTPDEPLVEVMTDKANVDLEPPVAGVLRERKFDEEARVRVGQVIAVIAADQG